VETELQILFTSAIGGGEWSASRPGRFTPGVKAYDTHWIRGSMGGPREGLNAKAKRKIPPLLLLGIESRSLKL